MTATEHPLATASGLARMDIQLVDLLLRGRIAPGVPVLDAGVGCGRNVFPLLRAGHPVRALDRDAGIVTRFAERARAIDASLPDAAFRTEPLEHAGFPDACAGLTICCAVLHFARDSVHFRAQLDQLWRMTAPGGLLFTRLASSEGLGPALHWLGGRRASLPDGSTRFLVDLAFLRGETARLGARLADPIRTALVHGQRAMTTWVLGKPA